jgi:sugar lactone lactonase YvrE
MTAPRAELAFDVGARLGEGALWDWRNGTLVSVDITGEQVLVGNPRDGSTRRVEIGKPVGAAMLEGDHSLLLAVLDGFVSLDLEGGELGELTPVEADNPGNRMNDGACDRRGRAFAGTMAFDETPGAGALYRLDPDLAVHTILTDVTISNGIDWSPGGDVMYHVDTTTRRIDAYSYDEDKGTPSEKRQLAATDPAWGWPDGLTVDAEGGIWVAFWDGAAVRRFSPEGAVEETIELPAARPTRPAFGGPDLDRLYVTTARQDPGAESDGDRGGAIFVFDPGVRGSRANVFRRA